MVAALPVGLGATGGPAGAVVVLIGDGVGVLVSLAAGVVVVAVDVALAA